MSSSYTYDTNGQLWPFFAFSVSTCITLPLTYVLASHVGDPAASFQRVSTSYRLPQADVVEAVRSKFRRKQRRTGLIVAVVVGWLTMAYSLYMICTTEAPAEQRVWNPYDILGIADSATEKVIKKTYKMLSLKFHPDKIRPDPAKNETLELLNERYVEITKAYQALTDEEIRNNYLLYGNPDGKQSTSIGIALPQVLIELYGNYVVTFYFALFGMVLPYLIGSWWYGLKSRSKEGVLMESGNRLFLEYTEDQNEASLIAALSTGQEFEKLFPGYKAEAGLATIEARITALAPSSDKDDVYLVKPGTSVAGMLPADREKLERLDNGARRKALALLWAYLGRVDLGDAALERAKFEVAPLARALARAANSIALAYGNVVPVLAASYASQHIMQAMPPQASPLLQLPHVTPAIVRAIEGDDATVHMTVQHLMDMADAKRRKLAVGPGRLTETQYQDAVSVAQQMPFLRVDKAFFKVSGEKFLIPGSLVTLVIKGRFIPPGFAASAPALDEKDLLDADLDEEDNLAVLSSRTEIIGHTHDGAPIRSDFRDCQPTPPPLAYAPYYGRDHTPRWTVFLTDSKQGKMIMAPYIFTHFEKPIFEADGVTPTFAVQMFKANFAAPPQAGQFSFALHVLCDSYVGLDTKTEVTLVVEDASKAEEMAAEDAPDDISEPDEDSIAGIMSAAKGEPIRRRAAELDDEDDESGTDEDVDDTSATNTDTEPEDN